MEQAEAKLQEGNLKDRGKVMVVDDNPLVNQLLSSLLKGEKYDVVACDSADQALDALDKQAVDLIICDIMMPQVSGHDLFNKLRDKKDTNRIPFLFLTALSDDENIARAQSAGVEDYITKPFDPRILLARVEGKLKRSKELKAMEDKQYETYRKQVLQTLSHELRTPLVAVNTGADLLMTQPGLDSKNKLRLLEGILRGGRRLERLVNDFVVLQQIEAGLASKIYEATAKEIRVENLLERVLELFEDDLERASIECKVEYAVQKPTVKVAANQMLDAIGRLISNAIKFSRENSKIEIVVQHEGEQDLTIEVRDNGVGIDEKKLDEALKVFSQVNRDVQEQQGGGFGLPIATKLIAINQGKLEVMGRHGGGTVARITLKKGNVEIS